MAKKRTGSLLEPRSAQENFNGLVTFGSGEKTKRKRIDLGTKDRATALFRLEKLVGKAADKADRQAAIPPTPKPPVVHPSKITVQEFSEEYFALRKARGLSSVSTEIGYYRNWIGPKIGSMRLSQVSLREINAVLSALAETGKARNTVNYVRAVMSRMFDAAWRAEIVESNPVSRSTTPNTNKVAKSRVILTDDEFVRLVEHPGTRPDLRDMAIVARTVGGMRTSDLMRWDWSMLEQPLFRQAYIPQGRKGRSRKATLPRQLEIPEATRIVLVERWKRYGSPKEGPVFPAEVGRKAGMARDAGKGSFAQRLRTGLIRAEIFRLPPTPVTRHLRYSKSQATREVTSLLPSPQDPLYYETPATMPVDWHSFRRAYNTALASAGVNVQQAMHLAGHSDPHVHMRYVQATEAMGRLPDKAMPIIGLVRFGAIPVSDSACIESKSPTSLAPPARVELAANGLGNTPETVQRDEIVHKGQSDEQHQESGPVNEISAQWSAVAHLAATAEQLSRQGDANGARILAESIALILSRTTAK